MNLIQKKYIKAAKKRRNKLYNLKQNIAQNREQKYICYIFCSGRNLYAQIVDKGYVVAHSNTIKICKQQQISRTKAIPIMSKQLFDGLINKMPNVSQKQIVFYMRDHLFAGSIKNFILEINKLFDESKK